MVRSFPGEAIIRALPSFRTMHWECKVGQLIHKTVDRFSRPGCVQLVNESEEQVGHEENGWLINLQDAGICDIIAYISYHDIFFRCRV